MTDTDLLRAVATGNAEAFRETVGRYGKRIVCFLDRVLCDHARATDLAQEAFMRFYKRLRAPGNEHTGDATSLLFTIAANLGRDELRRRKVRREAPLGHHAEQSAELSPGAGLEREERELVVRAALAALDADDRLLLVLREVQDLPYETIATILEVPLGTVKSRISRARLAFREAWVQNGGKAVEHDHALR